MADSSRMSTPLSMDRRGFLRSAAAASAAGIACGFAPAGAADDGRAGRVTRLSEHLGVFHGPVNTGIVRDGDRALLIDCGAGDLAAALKELGIARVERMVFTHYHRDQMCGAYAWANAATIAVPEGQRQQFADPAKYWNDDGNLWQVSRTFRPHHLAPVEPLRVDETLVPGATFRFGPAAIRVLSTPGHTEDSASYLVEVDGRRVVFSGDCLYGDGKLWDVFSLQKGFRRGTRRIDAYHGFMGDRWDLADGLERIRAERPERLIPSHGPIVEEPDKAIRTLATRMETCYEKYVAASALRHYFPELFTDYAGRPGQMPIRPGIRPPDCLRHFGTTWMLVSKDGAALVMDAGSPGVVQTLKKMLADGQIKSVDGLWVTHYHSDHTNGIPAFQKAFDCPCIMDRRLADVLTRPTAWRLPCVMAEPIRVDRPMEDGQSWTWHEFQLTSYNYPGQTLYHDALLAQTGELKMLFVGDSHTMAGLDDYCAYNRNWLGRGVGFQYCLDLVEKLQPTHMFNCHVDDAFTFTREEIAFIRENLDQRERLFGELVPWEHANFGLDPSWLRCDPYTQKVRPGQMARFDVVATNHAAVARAWKCRAVLSKSLGGGISPWLETLAAAKKEQRLSFEVAIAAGVPTGRYVVPVDVQFGAWNLPQFAEAIVDVVG